MAWEFVESIWEGGQKFAVSGGRSMAWQQGMHEERTVMLWAIEAGWAMANANCDVVMSGAQASREALG